MEEIIIRQYADSDYEEVKKILEEADMFDTVMDGRKILKKKIAQDSNSILVAEINKEIVGNVYLINDAWFSGIFRLAVKKEFRKRDIGQTLMQKAEKYLKDEGHPEVMIFVNSKYGKLINWYKKQGYQHSDNLFKALWKKF